MDFEGEGAAAALGHRHGRGQESHLYALRIWQCQAPNVRSGNRQLPRITRTNVLSFRYCPLRGLAASFFPAERRPCGTGGLSPVLRRQILAQPGDPAPVDVAGVNRVTRAVAGYRVGDELRRHAVVAGHHVATGPGAGVVPDAGLERVAQVVAAAVVGFEDDPALRSE